MFKLRSSLPIVLAALAIAVGGALPAGAQTLTVSPGQLFFEAEVGAPSPPNQTLRVETTPPGETFNARVEVSIISADWLSLLPSNGVTPADISVRVDSSRFTASGQRTANVRVTIPATGQSQVVSVTVTVAPPGSAPSFSAAPTALALNAASPGVIPAPQSLVIANSGGGILAYNVGVNYPMGGPQGWLDVSPTAGTVTLSSVTHQISAVGTAGFAQGTFTAELVFTSTTSSTQATNSPFSVPVTLTIGASPSISSNPANLAFAAVEGGGAPPTQMLEIRNESGGLLQYQIASDQQWLSVEPPNGDATAAPVQHQVAVDVSGLAQGAYTGNLTVTAPTLPAPFQIPVTLTIQPPARIFAAPSSVDFLGNVGVPIIEKRVINVVNNPPTPGRWTARVVPDTATWLSISPVEGDTPGRIVVEVNTQALTASTLTAEVEITGEPGGAALGEEGAPQQTVSTATVPVRLTVFSNPPTLSATPTALLFRAPEGVPDVLTQALRVANTGGQQIGWSASVETDDGNWLTVTPDAGAAPTLVQAAANTTGLAAGAHHGRIRISTGDQSATVPVVLTLSPSGEPAIDLDQPALYWETLEGGGVLRERFVRVLNRGRGPANWTAFPTGYTTPANWLTIGPAAGISQPDGLAGPAEIGVTPNATGLAPGLYGGLVEVRSDQGPSPLHVVGMLRVLPAGSTPPTVVEPAGLTFIAPGGGGGLPPQPMAVSYGPPGERSFQAGASIVGAGAWLSVSPREGSTDASGEAVVQVSADPTGLAAGVYRGSASLTFGQGDVHSAEVTLLVPRPGPGACTATAIALTPISPHGGFRAEANRAVPLEVDVHDNCGRPLNGVAVLASFNNSDPGVALERSTAGRYTGVWGPGANDSQANVIFTAVTGALTDRRNVLGSIVGSGGLRIARHGLLHGASFAIGEATSPGAIVSVFGRGFAPMNAEASNVPLPTTLEGAQLLLGGRRAPLYFASPGQLNIQAPTELQAGSVVQALALTGREYSVPEEAAVGAARPGMFGIPAATGPDRAIAQNQDGSLNSAANPAAPGEVVVVYLTGVGPVDPPAPTGSGAPTQEPLSRVTLLATATIGGQSAEIAYLGLTPTFVGLAQANLVVPEGIAAGAEVPIEIRIDGQPTQALVLAVGPTP